MRKETLTIGSTNAVNSYGLGIGDGFVFVWPFMSEDIDCVLSFGPRSRLGRADSICVSEYSMIVPSRDDSLAKAVHFIDTNINKWNTGREIRDKMFAFYYYNVLGYEPGVIPCFDTDHRCVISGEVISVVPAAGAVDAAHALFEHIGEFRKIF